MRCNTSLALSYNAAASLSFLNLRKLSERDLGPTNGSFVGARGFDHTIFSRWATTAKLKDYGGGRIRYSHSRVGAGVGSVQAYLQPFRSIACPASAPPPAPMMAPVVLRSL